MQYCPMPTSGISSCRTPAADAPSRLMIRHRIIKIVRSSRNTSEVLEPGSSSNSSSGVILGALMGEAASLVGIPKIVLFLISPHEGLGTSQPLSPAGYLLRIGAFAELQLSRSMSVQQGMLYVFRLLALRRTATGCAFPQIFVTTGGGSRRG